MPHISAEEVKEIRNRIKAAFPQFKVSVTRHHWLGVNIDFMEGPIALGPEGYEQVNHFFIHRTVGGDRCKLATAILEKANDIAHMKRGEGHRDSDYGYVPTYYISLGIGKWDREYVVRPKKVVIK